MRALLFISAALLATPAMAQDHGDHSQHAPAPTPAPGPAAAEDHSQHGEMDHGAMDHSQMDHGQMDHSQHGDMDHSAMGHGIESEIPSGPPPARAFEGPEHAADLYFDPQDMAAARAYNRATHSGMTTGTVLVERLEANIADGHDGYVWDVSAWYGTGTDKIVFKSEGEGEFGGSVEEAEAQLLWGHAVGPFVDLQVGMRVDAEPDTTAHAVIGLAGLAPYNVHFDLAAFVSDEGDLTARIEAEHDMRLSQRLILQPRAEAEIAAQDIPERGISSGFYHVTLGARLRYEIAREFAPYVGVEYATGDEPDRVALLLGLRTWF